METPPYPSSLREARDRKGATQEDVAAFLGVTRNAVSQWELGVASPGGPVLRLLAQFFEIPLEVVTAWPPVEKSHKAVA